MATIMPFSLNNTKKFCLYKKEAGSSLLEDNKKEGDDSELSVVVTNLEDDQEAFLRKHVMQKASKNLIYKTGSIHTLSLAAPPSPPKGSSPQLVSFMALLELAGMKLQFISNKRY